MAGNGNKEIPEKKKIIPEKHPMSEQPPAERIRNFKEVPYGYDVATAVEEARRCLQCKKPVCIDGCPVEIDIPGFIEAIAAEDFTEAIRIMKAYNNLPAVCGRVCPQEDQCEKVCVLAKKFEPVAIGRLERFIADYDYEHNVAPPTEIAPAKGRRV
jgi:glutamate synthase (NADPH/NADH) small chain